MLQDSAGSVAVVDQKSMKTTAHYPLGDVGRCNGLALDATKTGSCLPRARSRARPGNPRSRR